MSTDGGGECCTFLPCSPTSHGAARRSRQDEVCAALSLRPALISTGCEYRAFFPCLHTPHAARQDVICAQGFGPSHSIPQMYPQTSNADAFQTALKTKYPRFSESIKEPSGRAEMVAAICICAEQTFTESAATHKALGPACYIALNAYTGSDLERDVKDEITRIPPQDYRDIKDEIVPKLVQIIKTHRLRIKT
ncbi:hypothetical protein B0H14DRAFT_704231 [Mycena olivaceomarginata]|nr:hypothetical protein B0H14DRAFT_704231 [Mycena olivaceomarginata]